MASNFAIYPPQNFAIYPPQADSPRVIPSRRFSFNAFCGGLDKAYWYDFMQRYHPNNCLLMAGNDLAESLQVCHTTYGILAAAAPPPAPLPLVVFRRWSGHLEGWQWHGESAEQQVRGYESEGYPHIIRYGPSNEPGWNDDKTGLDKRSMVKSCVELMDTAGQAGFSVAIGNYAVGTWQPGEFSSHAIPNINTPMAQWLLEWLYERGDLRAQSVTDALAPYFPSLIEAQNVNSGLYDELLSRLAYWQAQGLHYLGVHEYTQSVLAFGLGQWPWENLLDPSKVQTDNWPTPADMGVKRWDGHLPPYWHINRLSWFLLRADEIGVARPKIIVTEFGWDNMPDMPGHLKDNMTQRYGIQPYNVLRCARSLRNQWDAYWRNTQGWNYDESFWNQLAYINESYPPEVVGIQLFSWGQWDDVGCDYQQDRTLHEFLIRNPIVYIPPSPPEPQPEEPPPPPAPQPEQPSVWGAVLILVVIGVILVGLWLLIRA